MDNKKTELFEKASIGKSVVSLSVPSVLSTLVTILYNMADMIFVGFLGDPVETAAVALAGSVTLLFFFITNLFGVGSSSLISRSLGRKDTDTAKKTAAFGFWLAVFSAALLSLVYTAFSRGILSFLGADEQTFEPTRRYLLWTVSCGAVPSILNVVLSNMVRSEGEAVHASIGVTGGCILNMLLDPFFILPHFLGMNAAGAGLATFISNSAATLYFLILIFVRRKTTVVCVSPRFFTLRKDIVREVFSVGIPAAIQNLLNVAGTVILNKITSAYGPVAISAMGIAHKISYVPNYVSLGISQGIMPLVGYNYSSGNRARMRGAILYVLRIGLIIAFSLAAGISLCSPLLIRMFINDADVVAMGKVLLRIIIWMAPFHTVDWLAVSVFQAIGKGGNSLWFAVARKIVFEIPFMFILNHFFGIMGLGVSQAVAEFFMCIIASLVLRSLLRDKTEKNAGTASV